ncbi:MAG: exodeoxyribonuclease VII small subunit [Pseudoclavibacter sp.]
MTEQHTPIDTTGGENADVAELGYEDARDQLATVVARLEQGSPTLEESLALWERGTALAARCEQWLTGARERLEAAQVQAPGTSTAPGTPAAAQDASGEASE